MLKSINLQVGMKLSPSRTSGFHIYPAAARSWRDVSSLTIGEGKDCTYVCIYCKGCFWFRKFKNVK